jgi:hypothetical protein
VVVAHFAPCIQIRDGHNQPENTAQLPLANDLVRNEFSDRRQLWIALAMDLSCTNSKSALVRPFRFPSLHMRGPISERDANILEI